MTVITEVHKIQIKALNEAGLGYKRIAKQLGLNRNTVQSYVRKMKATAHLPPKLKAYKGKITPRQQLKIKRYIIANPLATLDMIMEDVGLTISKPTLCRYLKRYGLERQVAEYQVIISDTNKRKRLDFAREMLQKDDDYLSRIMWTDETKVQVAPNGEIVFFRAPAGTPDEKLWKARKVQNGGGGVMFWGCMTRHAWGPLVVCEGTINGEKYLQLLKDVVIPEINAAEYQIVFQQDNAPAHKNRIVTDYLAQQDFETLQWPPQSPDLSPIEWIWNAVKMKVKALHPRPSTPRQIQEAVLDIWDNLEDSIRTKTIDTFRKRLRECIKNKGGLTSF
jgi:transposase